MAKVYPLDERGCRLLSSRQWRQLRERANRRPLDGGAELLDHYSQPNVKFKSGKMVFEPTEAEWKDAIRRNVEKSQRFA